MKRNENPHRRGPEVGGWPAVLGYWRTVPAEVFDDADKEEVIAFVRNTTSTIPEWRRAIEGDAAAAIAMVMDRKPPASIDIKVDYPMTVLLSCAFDDATAALVLSHKLRLMPLEPRLRSKLATSWLVVNMLSCLSRPPKRGCPP